VVSAFLAASVVGFPVTLLIAGSAAAFGPWSGMAFSSAGIFASAVIGYAIGRWVSQRKLKSLIGARLNRIRERIVREGVLAVAAIRLVPIAPFAVVNLAAGASEVRLADYVIGTAIGVAPGLIVVSFFGHQAANVLTNPTFANIGLLALAGTVWIGLAVFAQIFISKRRKRAA
jgi:uncharacterized membrane protein YdjX (TVP38/TMEM64 family)